METPTPKLITIKQASKILGVTPLTLRNWDNSGKFEASRHPINNYRVYKVDEIQALLDGMLSHTPSLYVPPSKKTRKLDVHHLGE